MGCHGLFTSSRRELPENRGVMPYLSRLARGALAFAVILCLSAAHPSGQFGPQGGRRGGGPGGPGGGPGGPGGPGGTQDRPIVAQFDVDKDGRLNTAERKTALEFLSQPGGGGGRGGGGFGGGR